MLVEPTAVAELRRIGEETGRVAEVDDLLADLGYPRLSHRLTAITVPKGEHPVLVTARLGGVLTVTVDGEPEWSVTTDDGPLEAVYRRWLVRSDGSTIVQAEATECAVLDVTATLIGD